MPTTTTRGSKCPRCSHAYPTMARFCAACGADVRGAAPGDAKRRSAFAVDPGEALYTPNLITSLMPMAGRNSRQTFRWALMAAIAIPIIAAAVGWLPFALAAAAIAVPAVYLVYLYEVNEWEDQPVPVILGALALAGALGFGFTLLWRDVILNGALSFLSDGSNYTVDGETLLVVGLLVPVGVLVLAQLGPLWLLMKRGFDDLIDGLTFGIAAGVAFAALESIALNSQLFLHG